MLRIVAENLAENSIRYAGHGARFTFTVGRAGEFVVLTAVDDGAGVAANALPRLFERFYRADAARTTRGTGLGLAIVKHIVVAAGGDIEAQGGRGDGLRMRCAFPLRRGEPRGPPRGPPCARRPCSGVDRLQSLLGRDENRL